MNTTIDPRQTLAQYVFLSKYARYRADLQRRETYEEAVDRVVGMHQRKFGDVLPPDVLPQIRRALVKRQILPSQRTMQFAGPAIERVNMRGYNCSFAHFNRTAFLAEAVWLLLCGCGVGFSVQRQHVAQLPNLVEPVGVEQYVVGDSIEGWADSFQRLFDAYTVPGTSAPKFDYSEVRPEGADLSTSSAKAPGPKPLRDALEACRTLLDRVVADGGVLRPIDAYDLVMHAASCVRAGGIRRSATIALFSPDDFEMMNAKTGDWFTQNPQRRLSNNSAVLVRKDAPRQAFDALLESTQAFGEPGFFFADDAEDGLNPCSEITLQPTIDGESGWAFCNLTSVNVAACNDRADFLEACVDAGRLGTIQAAYQDMGYLNRAGDASARIMMRDCLLGVSLTGMADNPDIAFDYELLRAGVDVVRMANEYLAPLLGIRPAARLTCVKPEGTGSLVLGVGNGIHPHHSRRYLRYVEGGKPTDPLVQFFAKHIPDAVVPSAYNPDEVKLVFPIDLGDGPLWLKQDTAAVDHLMRVARVQESWVAPGTTRGTATHNVSNTILVRPDEWPHVGETIWRGRNTYAGVALLGRSGDLDYPQAPFVAALTGDEIREQYGDDSDRAAKAATATDLWTRLRAAWVNIDWTECNETEDLSGGTEVVACAGGNCVI